MKKVLSEKVKRNLKKLHRENKIKFEAKRIKRECPICHKKLSISPFLSEKIRTCGSKECKSAYRKKHYKKENHYNYGKKLSKVTKEKKSESLKKAFKEGRMKHMKDVWKGNSDRWLKEKNPRWSGGWYINKYQYKMIHDDANKWRPEHRVVVERIIGRKLKRCETIHHINGIKFDNREENLYYFSHDSYHKRHHGLKNKPTLISNLRNIK